VSGKIWQPCFHALRQVRQKVNKLRHGINHFCSTSEKRREIQIFARKIFRRGKNKNGGRRRTKCPKNHEGISKQIRRTLFAEMAPCWKKMMTDKNLFEFAGREVSKSFYDDEKNGHNFYATVKDSLLESSKKPLKKWPTIQNLRKPLKYGRQSKIGGRRFKSTKLKLADRCAFIRKMKMNEIAFFESELSTD
jgi:hypothetical protein